MAALIKKTDRNLLKKSEVTKQYPLLVSILNKYEEFTIEDIDENDKVIKEFFEKKYVEILKEAKKEWFVQSDIVDYSLDKEEKCKICNRKIRSICFIKNKLNRNILEIGVGCIKEFLDGTDIGDIRKNLKEIRREKRIEKVKIIYPEIDNKNTGLDKYSKGIKEKCNIYIDDYTSDRKAEKIFIDIMNLVDEKNKFNICKDIIGVGTLEDDSYAKCSSIGGM